MTHRYTETVCAVNASYTDLDIPLRLRNSDYAGMEFSKNLKRFREAAGMRQEDVGDVLGVSQVTVGRWEKEQREPSFKDIEALAQVFGVATWDFFTPVGRRKTNGVRNKPIGLTKVCAARGSA